MVCLNIEYRDYNYAGLDFKPLMRYCFLSKFLDGSMWAEDIISGWEGGYYFREPADDYNDGRPLAVELRMVGPVQLYFHINKENIYGDATLEILPDQRNYLHVYDIEKFDNMSGIVDDGYYHETFYYEYVIHVTHESAGNGDGNGFMRYSMGSYTDGHKYARESLSGSQNSESFSDFDKYTLYMLYLEKVYGAVISNNPDCKSSIESEDGVVESDGGEYKYYIYTGNSGWCRISPEKEKMGYTVSGFTKDQKYRLNTAYDFEGLIKIMYSLDTNEILENGGGIEVAPVSGVTPPSNSDGGSNGGNTVKPDPCYENAGSLGWALCPLMGSLANSLGDLYDSVVEPFLVTNPELFPNAGGTHDAWNIMVGIANIVIVIFLLAVIFSQLTGVGIDNYGVKKILPKLIVVAVLVNLSYVICQLAVDLSNILGNSLQDLLSGINVGLNRDLAVVVEDNGGGEAGLFRALFDIAAGGLVAVGVGSIIADVASGGILAGLVIPFLLLLLTAVIAVLFFFIILGLRKAGVVILAILSPVAFVCYMLPNAKRWFDKWLKAFEGLLLVYPICGILIGGGQLTSKVILSASTDYIMYFTGCILMVVPFFFVPTLLKGSFAAMGNIGAKISGVGRNIGMRGRNKLDSTIKNSDGYQRRVKYNQDKAALRRANRTVGRLNRRSGGDASKLSRRQQAKMGAAMDVLKEQRRLGLENAQKSSGDYMTAMMNKQDLELDDAAQDLALYGSAGFVAAQRTKSQNARIEREAEANAGVFALNNGLAMSRARSRKEMQELKAYQDQFAGFSQADLIREAGYASTRLSQPGGDQWMSALISAMESNGMEGFIFGMIKSNDVSKHSRVMQTLAASNNKVLRAYGKKGQGIAYDDFMNGTGSGSLQGYISEKGSDFINGLDDKALTEIAKYNGGSAMSTDLLVEAAAKINSQDAVDQIDGMLSTRGGINISGEQLVQFNDSTVSALFRNAGARAAMDRATETIAGNPNLIGKLSDKRRQQLNAAFRSGKTML